MGTYLIYAESQYGGNAILSLGLGRNESNSGRSNIAISKIMDMVKGQLILVHLVQPMDS